MLFAGDNIHTAKHIARECGILKDEAGHTAMEGPVFRATPEEEIIPILPNLRVNIPNTEHSRDSIVQSVTF